MVILLSRSIVYGMQDVFTDVGFFFFRTQETGLPVSVSVRVGGKTFNLHKVRK